MLGSPVPKQTVLQEFLDWMSKSPVERMPGRRVQELLESGRAGVRRRGGEFELYLPNHPLEGPPLPKLANIRWPWNEPGAPTEREALLCQIDPKIRPVVSLLLGKGYKTLYSCEGGPGHDIRGPYVIVEGEHPEIVRLLANHGYPGSRYEYETWGSDDTRRTVVYIRNGGTS